MNPKLTPQVRILINFVKYLSLLDTGASHCFVSYYIAKKLGLVVNKVLNDVCVKIGNETVVQPLGECMISFKLGNRAHNHKFFVMKELPFSFILGMDFMQEAKIIIDTETVSWSYKYREGRKSSFINKEMLCALQGLQDSQKQEIFALLDEYPEVVTDRIGCTNAVQAKLNVVGSPVAQKPYPISYHKRGIIKEHVNKMLELGIISPSESEWASPVTLVKQGDSYRFCSDLRKINKVTKNDPYVIPKIDELLNRLGNAAYITKLDLKKGYWQIPMHPDSKQYTAFVCCEGKFHYNRMPFGLKTAPSIFQRFMNRVLGDARGKFAEAYLDDVIIYSSSWKEHIAHLKYIMDRFKQYCITINKDKCSFGETSIKYLGFLITPQGVSTDHEKTDAIRNYPTPKNWKDIKKFLGAVGWYRHYVPNFADKAKPLSKLRSF